MRNIRVIAPDGLSSEDEDAAIHALVRVGSFTRTQAKSLLSALLDMKLDSFEIPDGTQAKLQTLRNARLLVELVGTPDDEDEEEPIDETDEDEEGDEDSSTNEEVWQAWIDA